MGRAVVATGQAGNLVLDVNEVSYNVFGNYSDVAWALILDERVQSNSTWQGTPISATVGEHNVQEWWSGSFTFDWRPSGLQSRVIASGTNRVQHQANGDRSLVVGANMGNTGTGGAGGPTQITNGVNLTQLTQIPGKPTNVSATRISDTQVRVNWQNNGASNGQAASNQVWRRINGGAWSKVVDVNATNTATIAAAANQKLEFYVQAWNTAGFSPTSDVTDPVFTTPAAPSGVTATKNAALDIDIDFTENVSYSEYAHDVWHGVVGTGGAITWDGAALAQVGSGITTYTHVNPNASQVHVYRVRARQGALASAFAQSNSVQLLVAPNKPTLAALPSVVETTRLLKVDWVHNPVDTTPQTAYELRYTTNGGTNWTTSGKTVSTAKTRTLSAGMPAGTTLQVQVRTWGSATTGGSDGTGASPWSDSGTVAYRNLPVLTIASPAAGASLNDSRLRVTLQFVQAEGASFVKAELQLRQGSTTLETLTSNNLAGILMATPMLNGESYTIHARVLDSNGLWSIWKNNTFSVAYLSPPVPGVAVSYIEDNGWGQIDITVPAPAAGQAAAATVNVLRTINGITEEVVRNYPVQSELTFLDTVPTIHGVNVYSVVLATALGAESSAGATLTTEECRRAFLSKGPGFNTVGVFGANMSVSDSISTSSKTMEAAGRTWPIGLYGVETSRQVKVSGLVFEGFGSDLTSLRALLLVPGKACYRDSTGRRVFGTCKGSVDYTSVRRGKLQFTVVETA
ncbi:minor tail protein [Microbacterium phage Luna18]|nr:minor tail protein [Microbacterium phage Chepli]QZE10307.1 minor tail protein [Microbacterium phage KatChan]URQ04870.1 minor tail protein [Microbacterium phage Luna18]